MRMSRTPVFFDATTPWAPLHLARAFYAMHKRWGGGDDAPCCSRSTPLPGAPCTPIPASGSATCASTAGASAQCDHPIAPDAWWNGGVRKENIYFASRAAGAHGEDETVLCLRFQGDQATAVKHGSLVQRQDPLAGIPALGRTVVLGRSDIATLSKDSATPVASERVGCETCKAYPVDANNAKRVGSIITSAENYGSGLFEVYARVPPGNDHEDGGMGFVFAMWTFGYHETYPTAASTRAATSNNVKRPKGQGWLRDPAGQQLPGNFTPQPVTVPHLEFQGSNRFTCGLKSHNCATGPYTKFNHEIDIEIPSNACRLPRVDTSATGPTVRPGWLSDTMNANTWIGDNQDYNDGESYRNNGIRRMDSDSFIATSNNDFHWYGIQWVSGDDSTSPPTPPSVEYYFDRKLVHRITDQFIPSRAGKLNVGPWFGWWGGTPSFGSREVWIKYINIVPFAAVTDPWRCTSDAGAPKASATPCSPISNAEAEEVAQWFLPSGNTPPKAVTASRLVLPSLTAAQLSALYVAVASTQLQHGARPMPTPSTISLCAIESSKNDINAPQMFDQCGNNAAQNVCDYAQFLVDGDDGRITGTAVPNGSIPQGKVIGAMEPLKCPQRTIAQSWQASPATGVVTTAYLNPTCPRHSYIDVTVDPDPDMASRVRGVFPQSQLLNATSESAQLCGNPAQRSFVAGMSTNGCSSTTHQLLAAHAQSSDDGSRGSTTAAKLPWGQFTWWWVGFIVAVLGIVALVIWAVARRHPSDTSHKRVSAGIGTRERLQRSFEPHNVSQIETEHLSDGEAAHIHQLY